MLIPDKGRIIGGIGVTFRANGVKATTNSIKKTVPGAVSKAEKFMGAPKLGLLQAAKTAKGAMVKYAMPNINRAAAAVKQTVKATGDFAKQQKGNLLKIFDSGKNKLKSVGNKVSSGLNSLSGKLNRINDKYIGGKLNKVNERIISPKIEKFAVNPFNKFIGSGPGKNATLKQ
ncbi:MAG: hypothetical protein ACOY4Q_05505 [Bacillota bacterium]